ncbi:hypothetical protein [Conchiformibius kuhniae]|uniref:Uncharacterized protein n=1 Tax=Conchiformibius kuhniae TaxID=211502 RepID=A0A8T9MY41_9NEIS|nr:hypothetical protein [Conchiformibius kuhniae]UOP05398.1 hypothetical protein LVJ77_04235 [Conchiformibius kuhniae]
MVGTTGITHPAANLPATRTAAIIRAVAVLPDVAMFAAPHAPFTAAATRAAALPFCHKPVSQRAFLPFFSR